MFASKTQCIALYTHICTSPSYLTLAEIDSHSTDEPGCSTDENKNSLDFGDQNLPRIEGVLGVLVEKRSFAHARVSEGQEFDQIVIVHCVFIFHKSLLLSLVIVTSLIIKLKSFSHFHCHFPCVNRND